MRPIASCTCRTLPTHSECAAVPFAFGDYEIHPCGQLPGQYDRYEIWLITDGYIRAGTVHYIGHTKEPPVIVEKDSTFFGYSQRTRHADGMIGGNWLIAEVEKHLTHLFGR